MTPDVIALSFADADHKITRNDQGLVSLTDLWRASGKEERHKVTRWFDQAKPIVRALSNRTGLSEENLTLKRPGRYGGTFAHEKLAIAYAMWISPDFQLAVIDAFQDYWALRTGDDRVVDALPAALSRLAQFVITDISGRTGSDHIHFHPTRPEIGHHCVSLYDWCNATGVSAAVSSFEQGDSCAWLKRTSQRSLKIPLGYR